MAGTNVSTAPGTSAAVKQAILGHVQSILSTYFMSTLGTEPNIVNYVMAIIQHESAMRPEVRGAYVSALPTAGQKLGSSRAKQYLASAPVAKVLASGTPEQKANIPGGQRGQGLMQVMGWNIVRGGSSTAKQCEMEQVGIQTITDLLCVNAGDSIEAKLLGPGNIYNNVLAGMSLLHMKYKAAHKSGAGWAVGSGALYASRIEATIGAYAGSAAIDVVLGASTAGYVTSIVGGRSYVLANSSGGTATKTQSASAAVNGPSTNGTGVAAVSAGCA